VNFIAEGWAAPGESEQHDSGETENSGADEPDGHLIGGLAGGCRCCQTSHGCGKPATIYAAQSQLQEPFELVHLKREVVDKGRNCGGQYHGVRVV